MDYGSKEEKYISDESVGHPPVNEVGEHDVVAKPLLVRELKGRHMQMIAIGML